jgi:RND family efflux transporter MFP subunit
MLTLKETPIVLSSDFISTVRSLNSTTIQPQVDGRVTKIYVKSGDQVRVGTPLVQIDPEKEAANLRNTESQRTGREADVTYWKSQVERLRSLLTAGAISQNEFDNAQHSLDAAQANLAALDAQVREGRVQLQYYRVTAPTPGVVGDIAIREGDRITTSTVITTVDDKAGLEAYIQVPVDRAPDLKIGLMTQILDTDGKVLAQNPISFVSPVNGQYFCFIAEPAGDAFVARQHPIQVGQVLGNDYVVTGGLKAGDRLIVGGIQKIGDGAPVRPQ